MMKHYEVVAAVIEHDGKILCMQRNKGKFDYVSYKYAKEIVIGMFRTPFQTQFINKYFKKFSSIPIIQDSNPETLYNFYYTSQLLQKSRYEGVNGHKK